MRWACYFFNCNFITNVQQWIANLFWRIKDPLAIEQMDLHQLKYWNTLHEKLLEAEKDA